ncbi:phosphatidic acid phosphatase type 2/haloperoxidase [Auriculariales sp. MPI-PUGE-AT-0066]|nr:phosphatidic acid phosphatase type 2/haloperoxidase [Auriculariales sp. MPI-PUGE-AT-0066]
MPLKGFTSWRSASSNSAQSHERKISPWRILRHSALDWILAGAMYGVFNYLGGGGRQGFRRRFDINDTSIQFPFAEKERVTTTQLYLISLAAPAVIILVVSVIARTRSFADTNAGLLSLALAFSMTNSVTNIIKVLVGRPRPDMLDRCKPIAGAVNAAIVGLSTSDICTQTDMKRLNEGFRSFPSGHSSLSATGMTVLALFLAAKLTLYPSIGSGVKAWLCVVPLVSAALVAVSRTMDYRHHATDVLSGAFLGIIIGYASYRRYYPRPTDRLAALSYLPGEDPHDRWVGEREVREVRQSDERFGLTRDIRTEEGRSQSGHELSSLSMGPKQ